LSTLHTAIEALIFCAQEPISPDEISRTLAEAYEYELNTEEVTNVIAQLQQKYSSDQFAIQIQAHAGGFQFLTKPEHQSVVGILLKHRAKKRLSAAALETLAIIAYKQPITKTQIEQIRGVSCDYAVQKLLEKELITIKGKAEAVGRPILYGTTQKFMDYFGISSLRDLPQLKDVVTETEENHIGTAAE
jgi:segregation and condensation protein B